MRQASLFDPPAPVGPHGFRYEPELVSPEQEAELAQAISHLDLKPFAFRGYVGNRRTASSGWRYGFNGEGLQEAAEPPDFLLALRDTTAAFAGLASERLVHVLVTEYAPGAGIGWHRDRPEFADVVGVSLLSHCPFRLRRREEGGWRRETVTLEPRSAYLLSGEVRREWEHSIPPVDRLRYSVTFRSLAPRE